MIKIRRFGTTGLSVAVGFNQSLSVITDLEMREDGQKLFEFLENAPMGTLEYAMELFAMKYPGDADILAGKLARQKTAVQP